jgi:hypothetical protein
MAKTKKVIPGPFHLTIQRVTNGWIVDTTDLSAGTSIWRAPHEHRAVFVDPSELAKHIKSQYK